MAKPSLTPCGDATCVWAMIDRDGLSYPCERPSVSRLVDAPELWGGTYCSRHHRRALWGANAELLEDAMNR